MVDWNGKLAGMVDWDSRLELWLLIWATFIVILPLPLYFHRTFIVTSHFRPTTIVFPIVASCFHQLTLSYAMDSYGGFLGPLLSILFPSYFHSISIHISILFPSYFHSLFPPYFHSISILFLQIAISGPPSVAAAGMCSKFNLIPPNSYWLPRS
jgi:hypothetical protein